MTWLDGAGEEWLPRRRRRPAEDGSEQAPPPAPAGKPLPGRRAVTIYCPVRCLACLEAGRPARRIQHNGRDRSGRVRYHRCQECGAEFLSAEYLPTQLEPIDDPD